MNQNISNVDLKIPVTVYIDPGDSVNVTQKKVNKPNYLMIGNGTMNKHKVFAIDFLRELVNSSKAEQTLLLLIKDGISYENNYHHIVKLDRNTMSSTQQRYVDTAYKSLKERNLVIRTKKSHYMINPNALIPLDYEQAVEDWLKAGGR